MDNQPTTVRIGQEYQAEIPKLRLKGQLYPDDEDNSETNSPVPCWIPKEQRKLPAFQLDKYVQDSKQEFKMPEDLALGFLYHTNYNFTMAKQAMQENKIKQVRLSPGEKLAFLKGIKQRKPGEGFSKIKKMIPNKSVKEIVYYYYHNWKGPVPVEEA